MAPLIPFAGDRPISRPQFEGLVQAQLPQLYRTARGLADQAADAEDLVHDACVKAIDHYHKARFNNSAQVAAWVNRILVNTFRDRYRRKARSPVQSTDYHATSDPHQNVIEMVACTEMSPPESLHNRDSSYAISHALSMLPPEVRVVSVLFLVSGLSYQEIADVTDCPIGTVMSRLSRGRQSLKAQLSEFAPGVNMQPQEGRHENL
ncbi:MAG: sigma-70 family RNA polymerase sigma factor [Pseudomonadota bacterium]